MPTCQSLCFLHLPLPGTSFTEAAIRKGAFRTIQTSLENRKEQSARDYSAAVEAYETAGQLLRSDDDATYYQQLQSLIQQLQKEGWING